MTRRRLMAFWLIQTAINVAIWVGIIWVATHFLRKVW